MGEGYEEMCKLADVMTCRRDRFGLIASVFEQESSEETVTHMITQALAFGCELDGSIELDLNRGLSALACDDISAFATRTRTEYTRLFLGPRKVMAPLHESAYLSGTSRMFTAETMAVRKFYERYGYVMKAKNREPEDGVGVEFEFLRNLCDRCIALLEQAGAALPDASGGKAVCATEGKSVPTPERKATVPYVGNALLQVGRLLEAQRAFKEQHLSRWAYLFAQRVIENDKSGFYAVWAKYLLDVLDEDDALLRECDAMLTEREGFGRERGVPVSLDSDKDET